MAVDGFLADLFSLDGRTAIVTGGSSGIGRAIAAALAGAGANVVLLARTESALAAAASDMRDPAGAGGAVAWVAGDRCPRQGARAALDLAAAPFGEPDSVVNSAGINLRPPMGEVDDDV